MVDGIGVFFDQGATTNCAVLAPYTPLTVYLIAIGISEPSGLSGWQAGVFTYPATLPVPFTVNAPGCIVGCSLPYVQSVLLTPVPRAPAIVLATMSTFYLGGIVWLGVGPYQPTPPENPGLAYVAGDGSNRLIRLTPYACGSPVAGDPAWVAGVDVVECCGLPAEDTSWGSIKRLYH